ncbi:MAG: hypothetical protein ACI9OJ_004355, partial [Myxococcota bacterium]
MQGMQWHRAMSAHESEGLSEVRITPDRADLVSVGLAELLAV